MRRALVLMIFMGCRSTEPATGGLQATVDRDAIVVVLTAQADAWNRGDIDAFMAGYWNSDELTFQSGDQVTRGFAATRDRYKKKYDSREKMGTLTFSDLDVRKTAPDRAAATGGPTVVTGRWKLTRAGDTPGGTFILIFHRFADGWKIVHDDTSSDH